VFEATVQIFPFIGQVHVQICTKISVKNKKQHNPPKKTPTKQKKTQTKNWCILNSTWTNLLNKKTCQEFLDTTSDLESPTAADHRKFSLKLILYMSCLCASGLHLWLRQGSA